MFRKLVKALIPRDMFRSIEPTGHFFEAVMWQILLGWPARGLKVIGVTGTNGKTSTSYMIQRMLFESGYKVGLMSTVGYGVGLDIKPQVTHMTTSSTKVTLERIKELRAQGMEWLVLETTSHALAQNRVWGIPYGLAVMTNITHEHLEYHRTFERYRDAKVKLFRLTAANRGGRRLGVVNADDPNAPYFLAAVPKHLTYGVHAEAEVKAVDVKSGPGGSEYQAEYKGRKLHIRTQLPGSFNVDNSLAAVSVGLALGLKDEQIEHGVAALERVEGRMTRIDEGQDFSVIVDYAHSPDSFEKLFADVRPMVRGRIIAVFGSQGSTGDVAKRAIQGKLAGESADAVVVTEEDDRGEDGRHIMEQIAEGAEKAGKVRERDLWLIHNRTEAIRYGVGLAHKGDVVLILGKGHEKTIERTKDGEEPWDEPGEARAAIRALKK
jgi:UDP-N-acetylmuramoyl-L-alanyl-D-glutamate--2,6-diaminopimelate ligase